jgi:hypothetical protein
MKILLDSPLGLFAGGGTTRNLISTFLSQKLLEKRLLITCVEVCLEKTFKHEKTPEHSSLSFIAYNSCNFHHTSLSFDTL